ncbi:MAG: sugar kinase [Pseudomonadota bacterium]
MPEIPQDRLTSVKRIACIGEVMIELTPAAESTLNFGVAGDSYNTAVYLKRLLGTGCDVDYMTALGTDAFSDRILAEMGGHGLGLSAVERRSDRLPGIYAIATDDSGERSFTYWRSESAARTLFVEPCEVPLARLQDYDLVLLTGISIAILPEATRGALVGAIKDFRTSGGILAYDSNHRPRLWATGADAQVWNRDFWGLADIALPSVDDEMLIFGDDNESDVIARLIRFGVGFGALKRGPEGPYDFSGMVTGATYPAAARVIDTTAAGDSFNAGYLAGLVAGKGQEAALRQGHDLAAQVIGHRGAIVETALSG